jgi:hypothetical protein
VAGQPRTHHSEVTHDHTIARPEGACPTRGSSAGGRPVTGAKRHKQDHSATAAARFLNSFRRGTRRLRSRLRRSARALLGAGCVRRRRGWFGACTRPRTSSRRRWGRGGAHRQPATQDTRLEDTSRSIQRAATVPGTSRCCDDRLSPVSTCRFATPSGSPEPARYRRSDRAATAMTVSVSIAVRRPDSCLRLTPRFGCLAVDLSSACRCRIQRCWPGGQLTS